LHWLHVDVGDKTKSRRRAHKKTELKDHLPVAPISLEAASTAELSMISASIHEVSMVNIHFFKQSGCAQSHHENPTTSASARRRTLQQHHTTAKPSTTTTVYTTTYANAALHERLRALRARARSRARKDDAGLAGVHLKRPHVDNKNQNSVVNGFVGLLFDSLRLSQVFCSGDLILSIYN
jgi:hypothetical protein